MSMTKEEQTENIYAIVARFRLSHVEIMEAQSRQALAVKGYREPLGMSIEWQTISDLAPTFCVMAGVKCVANCASLMDAIEKAAEFMDKMRSEESAR